MSSQEPSSRTIQKKFMVSTSLKAMTSMKSELGATPRRRVRMPRLALMTAKGMSSLSRSSAPCENGLKIGISRYTESSEKDEMEAMLPVEKKADCNRKKKKREGRRSERESGR